MTIQTVNPATGKIIHFYSEMTTAEVSEIIDKTHEAYLFWRDQSFATRSKAMRKMAELLQNRKQDYAKIISTEMGKPIQFAVGEIEKCAWVCEHYAENAETYLQARTIKTEMKKSFVSHQPLGIVFAIMPWNFPFWQVYRFAAPTIMAGNAALLKHAPISTGAALAMEELFIESGFPKNLFRSLILDNAGAEKVIENPKVIAVTLTGSGRAGKAVASEAGKVLKKAVLELGGSDPYLILKDADLDLAADACVTSRMNNSGQVCISAKRIIMVPEIRAAFEKLVLEKIQKYVMGDPLDAKTNFGPLAREDIRAEVHRQVQESVAKGAQCLTGGFIPEGSGFYYPPTVLSNVQTGMPAYEQEIFGPVMALLTAQDEEDAIRIANDSIYGLAGAVFTNDLARGEKIATEKLQVGSCAVNTFVASDPRLPFGGIKESGYGRELSAEGIQAFVNVKTIVVK